MAKNNQNPATTSTFAERTAEMVAQENAWQQYNSDARFYAKNMVKSLEELASLIFPTDNFNSNAYQEALVESLTKTISPEIGIKDFWKEMGKSGCKTLRIEDGHLNFLDEQGQKIDITHYTQPIVFEAQSSYYRQRQLEREKRIMIARQQLQELLKEIHRR
jgi:hypothetical protein